MKYLLSILIAIFVAFKPYVADTQNLISVEKEQRSPRVIRGERKKKDMQESIEKPIIPPDYIRWQRVLYRKLDLHKESNASLYYPPQPLRDKQNLFSLVFRLIKENQIKAYEYLDGVEIFENEYAIRFIDLVDKMYIPYQQSDGKVIINDNDIPSPDVLTWYVKEKWYFDQHTSAQDVKIVAICPVLTLYGDIGKQQIPLCWIPYQEIQPYLKSSYVTTSNVNSATLLTLNDYFLKRMFEGEIIKTENLLNQTLQEQYTNPDSLRIAQQQIENELKTFRSVIYRQPDINE